MLQRDRSSALLGNAEIARSANVANRLLERPTRAMATLSEGSPVAKTLLDLRATVEKLVPPNVAKALAKKAKQGLRTGATEPKD